MIPRLEQVLAELASLDEQQKVFMRVALTADQRKFGPHIEVCCQLYREARRQYLRLLEEICAKYGN